MDKMKQTPKPRRKTPRVQNTQQLTDLFTALVKADLKATCVKEFKFHPTRKWRFDYALPEYKVAVEIDGGVWTQGRHTRPQGYINDLEKFNEAAAMGWLILKFTPQEQYRKATLELIKRTIDIRQNERAMATREGI